MSTNTSSLVMDTDHRYQSRKEFQQHYSPAIVDLLRAYARQQFGLTFTHVAVRATPHAVEWTLKSLRLFGPRAALRLQVSLAFENQAQPEAVTVWLSQPPLSYREKYCSTGSYGPLDRPARPWPVNSGYKAARF